MDPLKSKIKNRPEAIIQEKLIEYLRYREWFVKPTHGNMYQSGFPDLYASHMNYGHRWIEVKLPDMKGSKFTPAQITTFPQMAAAGSRIYILTGADDRNYEILKKDPNWHIYFYMWKKH